MKNQFSLLIVLIFIFSIQDVFCQNSLSFDLGVNKERELKINNITPHFRPKISINYHFHKENKAFRFTSSWKYGRVNLNRRYSYKAGNYTQEINRDESYNRISVSAQIGLNNKISNKFSVFNDIGVFKSLVFLGKYDEISSSQNNLTSLEDAPLNTSSINSFGIISKHGLLMKINNKFSVSASAEFSYFLRIKRSSWPIFQYFLSPGIVYNLNQ